MTKYKVKASIFLVVFSCLGTYRVTGSPQEAEQLNGDVDPRTAKVIAQPCRPYDSCENRCIKDSQAIKENVTIGQFNCFCDSSCETFGDCCWDYHSECIATKNSLEKTDGPNSVDQAAPLLSRYDSFECVVVDQFSKGAFWMVTRCANDWKNQEMARKCEEVEDMDFSSNLPVLGDTGWTYRNVFCAQCNHVTNYFYWSLNANCIRSAPEEVLSGDPEMLSYYFEHFCVVKLQQDTTFEKNSAELLRNHLESIAWKKSLRSCVQGMVDRCPDGYEDDSVARACSNYQTVLIKPRSNFQNVNQIFKNPFCALCNGVDVSDLYEQQSISDLDQIKDLQSNSGSIATTDNKERAVVCPVWLLSTYYDNEYWKIDTRAKTKALQPSFNKNHRTSSWTPPSFSILMRFTDENDMDMTYHDESASAVKIPAQEQCQINEIYDPFVGRCRPVFCANNMVYTASGCVPAEESQSHENGAIPSANLPNAVTVTISITVPSPAENHTDRFAPEDVGRWLLEAFEEALSKSAATNFTVVGAKTLSTENCSKSASQNRDSISISISFVVLSLGNYTNEDVVKIVELLAKVLNFEELVVDFDSFSVMVLEYSSNNKPLSCKNNEKKVQYTSEEYELEEFDGRKLIFINQTNSYYSEDEFQLLDWAISLSENGVETSHVEESRVVVCSLNYSSDANNSLPCNLYLPLNSSEYKILENRSVYLEERDMMIEPEDYITFNGGIAACLDGYTTPSVEETEIKKMPINSAQNIINWVTFGLTIFALASLLFTFITYCIFSELRTVSGWNIMNLTTALFAALLVFSFGAYLVDPPDLCMAIAIILHYLYLSTFFWNNVMAYDVWATFGKGLKLSFRMSVLGQCSAVGRSKMIRKTALKYMLYGWGMPALLVGVCVAIECGLPHLGFGYRFDSSIRLCWITNGLSNILAFGVPLALILLINGIFFVLSIKSIQRMSTSRKRLISNTNPYVKTFREVDISSPPASTSSENANDDIFADDSPPHKVRKTPDSTRHAKKAPARRRLSSATVKSNLSSARISILIYVKMSSVMGFTWFFGFFSVLFPDVVPLRYIFEILVPLQGVFIFFVFICKKRIFLLYKGLAQKSKKKDKHGENTFTVTSKPIATSQPALKLNEHHARSLHLQSRSLEWMQTSSSSDSICSFSRRLSGNPGEFNLAFENEIKPKLRSPSESSQDDKL